MEAAEGYPHTRTRGRIRTGDLLLRRETPYPLGDTGKTAQLEGPQVDDALPPLKSPDCPVCGHPPKFMFSSVQAFCGNDECNGFTWNPSETPAHQRAHQHHILLTDAPAPTTEQ